MDVFKTPGAVSWTELQTPDPAAAARFYGELFGWNIKDMGEAMGGYRVITVGEAGIGGITGMPPGSKATCAQWGAYVTVANVEEVLARCAALGGKTLVPPMDIPTVGRMAVLQDPQGAVISVMAYNMPG